jgi:hypothetical protein
LGGSIEASGLRHLGHFDDASDAGTGRLELVGVRVIRNQVTTTVSAISAA